MKSRLVFTALASVACPVLNADLTYIEFQKLKDKGPPFFLQIDKPNDVSLDGVKVQIDVHRLSASQAAADTELGSSSLKYFNSEYGLTASYKGSQSNLKTWVDHLQDPITYLTEESQMHELLRSRDPNCACATVIVVFIPPENTKKLALFKHFVMQYFCRSSASTGILFSHGEVTTKFAVVTDNYLARRMFIVPEAMLGESQDDLLVYKYYQPDTVFYKYLSEDFRDADALRQYDANAASRKAETDIHLKQLRLKLNRSKYVLSNNLTRLNYENIRAACVPDLVTSSLDALVKATAIEQLLVLPWTSRTDTIKSMDCFLPRQGDPHLVVSTNNAQEAVGIVKRLGVHELAKANQEEMLTVIGSHKSVKLVYDKHHKLTDLPNVAVHYFVPVDNGEAKQTYRMPEGEAVKASDISSWINRVRAGHEAPLK